MDSLPSLPSLTCPRLVVVLSQRVLVSGSQQNPSVRSRGPADHRALLESPYLGLGHRPGTLSNDQPVTGSAHWPGQGWRVRPDHCRGPAPWFMSLSMSCFDCVLPPDSPRLQSYLTSGGILTCPWRVSPICILQESPTLHLHRHGLTWKSATCIMSRDYQL